MAQDAAAIESPGNQQASEGPSVTADLTQPAQEVPENVASDMISNVTQDGPQGYNTFQKMVGPGVLNRYGVLPQGAPP